MNTDKHAQERSLQAAETRNAPSMLQAQGALLGGAQSLVRIDRRAASIRVYPYYYA